MGTEKLPSNADAEMNVIGCVFNDNSLFDKIYDVLEPEDFYDQRCENIYRTMRVLHDRGSKIDIVTVADVLEQKGKSRDVGGIAFLTEVTAITRNPKNISSYAGIVKQKASLRRLVSASGNILEAIRKGKYDDPEELQKMLKDAVEDIDKSNADGLGENALVTAADRQEKAMELIQSPDSISGISTGVGSLDKVWRGMEAGDLIIIGGETRHGKSMLLQKIALNLVLKQIPVLYLSLEMTVEQQLKRFYSMNKDEHGNNTVKVISASPLVFYGETESMTLRLLEKLIRSSVEKHGIKMVFIDHLHYFQQDVDNVTSEVGLAVRRIKEMARRYDMPIAMISTLRKLNGKNKVPTYHDLKDSVMIGYDADVISMVYRNLEETPDEMVVDTQKNRPRGVTGKIKLNITENYNLVEMNEIRNNEKAEKYQQSRADLYG